MSPTGLCILRRTVTCKVGRGNAVGMLAAVCLYSLLCPKTGMVEGRVPLRLPAVGLVHVTVAGSLPCRVVGTTHMSLASERSAAIASAERHSGLRVCDSLMPRARAMDSGSSPAMTNFSNLFNEVQNLQIWTSCDGCACAIPQEGHRRGLSVAGVLCLSRLISARRNKASNIIPVRPALRSQNEVAHWPDPCQAQNQDLIVPQDTPKLVGIIEDLSGHKGCHNTIVQKSVQVIYIPGSGAGRA